MTIVCIYLFIGLVVWFWYLMDQVPQDPEIDALHIVIAAFFLITRNMQTVVATASQVVIQEQSSRHVVQEDRRRYV